MLVFFEMKNRLQIMKNGYNEVPKFLGFSYQEQGILIQYKKNEF